ncbi:MAG: transcription elongation factor subunit Spt4 [Methermicoccaceae archaeon]
MSEKVCRECHRIVKGDECPVCHSGALSTDWSGYVVIIDPATSQIAHKMNIKTRGKFALKVR